MTRQRENDCNLSEGRYYRDIKPMQPSLSLFVVSAGHSSTYITSLSSMMLITMFPSIKWAVVWAEANARRRCSYECAYQSVRSCLPLARRIPFYNSPIADNFNQKICKLIEYNLFYTVVQLRLFGLSNKKIFCSLRM